MQLGQNSQTHSLKKYCVLMPKEEPIKMPNEMRQQLILAVRQDQRFRPHALIRLSIVLELPVQRLLSSSYLLSQT